MKADELELFEHLSRNSKFREWLNSKLEEDVKVLVQSNDMVQIHKAQGRAGLLNQMIRLLNEAPAALKR